MKRILIGLTVLFALVLTSCDQSQAPSSPQSSSVSKAVVTRDIPLEFFIYNTCCGDDELVMLTGTAKSVVNDNSSHTVIKDIAGTCVFGGHTYTTDGATVINESFTDNQYHMVLQIRLVNDEGCAATVKVHYKLVYDEIDGWVPLFDRYELLCGNE